ncbi:MAG TPA: NADH-quinone oxidoreductase subunit M [Chloroflexota bacterium]
MTTVALIAIPLVGGIIAWIAGRAGRNAARWVALVSMFAQLALVVSLWAFLFGPEGYVSGGQWLDEVRVPWIPQLGVSFHLGIDGLSLLLVVLTAFLGVAAVIASWSEVTERVGFFHFNLLWVLAGITGVFLALDMLLFYFFWEIMLVPSYFLFLWGYERRLYAGVKFFIFTLVSGLLMLVAIIGLAVAHQQATGTLTFDYMELLRTPLAGPIATWLMLGFFIGFAVKLPVFPFHSWQPDAYVQSPTAATVVLAGVMAKTAGYGFLRFVVPLFPQAALAFAPVAMTLAVIGILYGAIVAFGQTDFKRLIAYSSLGHMGFVLLGVFAWNELALQGAVMEMVAHGVSTGALFILLGWIIARTGSRDMSQMGGLWAVMPRLSGVTLFFVLALVGLPGLGNFVAEFLVLVGTFQVSVLAAAVASLGIVLSAVYGLWMVQRTFQGSSARPDLRLPDLSMREGVVMAALVVAIVWLGLFPQFVIGTAKHGLDNLRRSSGSAEIVAGRIAETGVQNDLFGGRAE